ncbi:enamine deaminase RidA (YjgF/YER057c/UK114 family) [Alteromonadaceae bacterium 2753L.S.0a.02]|nr:enamine deaminase RidA (YjgF/YER057c/UK114 family) [Alteromonadaceae bacterium 2753L.S.0a.02]
MTIETINPASLYDGSNIGMSHAKVDKATGLVFISGQVDWNRDMAVKNSDIAAQTNGAIDHLITVLNEANSCVENILQLRIYVKGDVNQHMDALVPVVAKRLGIARPALTGVGVQSLASPDTLVEIEAVAKTRKLS